MSGGYEKESRKKTKRTMCLWGGGSQVGGESTLRVRRKDEKVGETGGVRGKREKQ